jgi:AraC-like DNA-binding protein
VPWATAITALHIRRALARVGGDPDILAFGSAGAEFEDRISVDALCDAWEKAVAATARRDLPAIAASYVAHDEKSLLAFLVANQPRFRDAMHSFVTFFPAVSDAYAWNVTFEPARARLFAAPAGPIDRLGWQLHQEFEMVDSIRSGMLVTAGVARPTAVCFAHARPPQPVVDALAAVLGTEPRFGEHAYSVEYPIAALDASLPQARPALAAVIEDRLRSIMAVGQTLAGRTRAAIHKLLGTSCSVDAIASSLGMSRRALERALAAEGTSATALLDEERRRYALAWLETHSVQEVAVRLGYSDRRAFARAFRRWTGTSPLGATRRGTDSA